MKKLCYILFLFLLSSCEKFALERSDVTLSGKYVVSKLEITSDDRNNPSDSLYTIGTTFINTNLPDPFDSIRINRFYLAFSYSEVWLNFLGVDSFGYDKWEYGGLPKIIVYNIIGNTTYSSGYLQFDYITKDGSSRRMTFYIEDDGIESLQLKSSGSWFKGVFGKKQYITLYLTRVGP